MRQHAQELRDIFEEHDFDETSKSALTRYFEFSAERYDDLVEKFKVLLTAVAICLVLICGGCAAGIFALKHQAAAQEASACWERFNGRVVLRALTFSTGGDNQRLANAITDPELKLILEESFKNSKEFKTLSRQLLPLPDCEGTNPNPIDVSVLERAQVPINQR